MVVPFFRFELDSKNHMPPTQAFLLFCFTNGAAMTAIDFYSLCTTLLAAISSSVIDISYAVQYCLSIPPMFGVGSKCQSIFRNVHTCFLWSGSSTFLVFHPFLAIAVDGLHGTACDSNGLCGTRRSMLGENFTSPISFAHFT